MNSNGEKFDSVIFLTMTCAVSLYTRPSFELFI